MNCAEFSELAFDLARNEGLDDATRAKALAHADACPRCDEELVMARSLMDAMRTLAASTSADAAPARVEEALCREMQRRSAAGAIRPRGGTRWVIGAAVGIAAAALLSVALLRPGTFRWGGVTSPNVSVPSANVSSPAAGTAAQIPPAATVPNNQDAAAQTAGNGGADDSANAQDSDTEYATAYVPLPSADGMNFAEDQTIVRVSLPPSALASFGLPISSDGHDSNVLADFVLGEDGMPQAVRLVQSN